LVSPWKAFIQHSDLRCVWLNVVTLLPTSIAVEPSFGPEQIFPHPYASAGAAAGLLDAAAVHKKGAKGIPLSR
jgi:hypothetical protein